jgi:3',5'-nucleoside bisphosphate phosphatase
VTAAPALPDLSGLIDLHSHTNASDGSYSPAELVELASSLRLDGLSIADHDTFAGYEAALPLASAAGLDLLCGIELSSRYYLPPNGAHRTLHLLAYFPAGPPSETFGRWLKDLQEDRRDRNRRLVAALQSRGIDISLEEVENLGRSIAGRPHFARLLVQKGHARNAEEAFRLYLGENAPTYVERESPTTQQAIGLVAEGGGVPVVAHPVRLSISDPGLERKVLEELKASGLGGLEVYHSDHSAALQSYYLRLAEELDLLPTGGSDFHGDAKPGVQLGRGIKDNIRVPRRFLDRLRELG